jgi:hypothetical protein
MGNRDYDQLVIVEHVDDAVRPSADVAAADIVAESSADVGD